MSQPNCPFYGHSTHFTSPRQFILISTQGNQCALLFSTFAPCYMEINGKPIDWRECPNAKTIRGEEDDGPLPR